MPVVDAQRQVRRHSFHAMGTAIELLGVDVPLPALHGAAELIEDLEARWSRFRATSEICCLNASPGRPVALADETVELISAALAWSSKTDGWFDPTVLGALEAAGYDRTFGSIPPDRPPSATASGSSPGADAVAVDLASGTVEVRPGAGLDLGGIGKGRAADLVAERWAAAGWSGCANLGGDLRAVGTGPDGVWSAAVHDPFDAERTVAVIGITEGALATSSTTRRTWRRGGISAHHLIDPRTGRPSTRPPASVTVVAPTAVEAEVWAKALLLAGSEAVELVERCGRPALFIDATGIRPVNGMEEFLW
jgi:thiamine biosynthesis lipoprotein